MEVHPQAQNNRMVSFFFYFFFHIHDRINNEIHPSCCVIKPSFFTQVWNEEKVRNAVSNECSLRSTSDHCRWEWVVGWKTNGIINIFALRMTPQRCALYVWWAPLPIVCIDNMLRKIHRRGVNSVAVCINSILKIKILNFEFYLFIIFIMINTYK